MKHLIALALFLSACYVEPEAPPTRADVEPYAWKCGGSVAFFEWVCDTFNGEWQKVYVGFEERNCGYPYTYTLEGKQTSCKESAQHACGGGDDDACNVDTCELPPSRRCDREPVDPPPCCLQ
jgi:hypothetical protein